MKISNWFNNVVVFVCEHPKEISAGLALFASVLLSAKSSEQKQLDPIDICLNAASDAAMTKEEAVVKAIEAVALKERNDFYKNEEVKKIVNICESHPEVIRVGTTSVQRIMQSTKDDWYRRCMMNSLARLL